jgi:hypothetical protein
MMKTRIALTLWSVCAATLLAGCAQDPSFHRGAPNLESHFGDAVRQARAMQVIHPEGAAVTKDEGYSGKAADRTMRSYDGAPAAAAPTGAVPVAPAVAPPAPPR